MLEYITIKLFTFNDKNSTFYPYIVIIYTILSNFESGEFLDFDLRSALNSIIHKNELFIFNEKIALLHPYFAIIYTILSSIE